MLFQNVCVNREVGILSVYEMNTTIHFFLSSNSLSTDFFKRLKLLMDRKMCHMLELFYYSPYVQVAHSGS